MPPYTCLAAAIRISNESYPKSTQLFNHNATDPKFFALLTESNSNALRGGSVIGSSDNDVERGVVESLVEDVELGELESIDDNADKGEDDDDEVMSEDEY